MCRTEKAVREKAARGIAAREKQDDSNRMLPLEACSLKLLESCEGNSCKGEARCIE